MYKQCMLCLVISSQDYSKVDYNFDVKSDFIKVQSISTDYTTTYNYMTTEKLIIQTIPKFIDSYRTKVHGNKIRDQESK
jgi:hypothetical protein